jgi:hypothetical protein
LWWRDDRPTTFPRPSYANEVVSLVPFFPLLFSSIFFVSRFFFFFKLSAKDFFMYTTTFSPRKKKKLFFSFNFRKKLDARHFIWKFKIKNRI